MTITFGTAIETIEYAGAVSGFVGINPIKVRIPANTPAPNDVPISIAAGGRAGHPVTRAIGP